jgi:1-deoxy-D-xylulose-5-phosphate reductoisomerase
VRRLVGSEMCIRDRFATARLDFERPDVGRFPCLPLAYEAHARGGYATIALNAANEEAVKAFLGREIGFTDIPALVGAVMRQASSGTPLCLEDILVQDEESRARSLSWIKNKKTH